MIDLDHELDVQALAAWLHQHGIEILNVAGPRESKQSGIGKAARAALEVLLAADCARPHTHT